MEQVTGIGDSAINAVKSNPIAAQVINEATNDIKIIINNFKNIIPNIILIVSIGIMMFLIILATTYTDLHTVSIMTSFYYTVNPCTKFEEYKKTITRNSSCKVKVDTSDNIIKNDSLLEKNIQFVLGDFQKEYCDIKNISDLEGGEPFFFVCKAASLVCANVSNIVINNLSSIININKPINRFGILFSYILLYTLCQLLHKIIAQVLSKILANQNQAFIFNIIYSIFSVIILLFIVCLVPSIITYICYLIYGLLFINANISTNALRMMYFMLLAFIPIASWFIGFTLQFAEGFNGTTSDCSNYNWIFGVALIFLIPSLIGVLMMAFDGSMIERGK